MLRYRYRFFVILLCTLLCSFVFSAPTVVADSPAQLVPFEVLFDEGNKIFYYTPEYYYPKVGEEITSRPKNGLYYNTNPLTNIYYLDENVHISDMGLYKGSMVFSDDGMCFAYFPWPWNDGITWGITGLRYKGETTGQAILFFNCGQLVKEYQVKDLLKNVSKAHISISHIDWAKSRVFNADNNVLTVTTKDNRVYQFDITSGKIVRQSTGVTGKLLFVFLLVMVIIPCTGVIIMRRNALNCFSVHRT